MDYVEYFTKQLPLDLARLAELRDELKKRQGALTAVDETIRDRDAAASDRALAAETLRQAKADADKLLKDAEEVSANNLSMQKSLARKERDLNSKESDLINARIEFEAQRTAAETNLNSRDEALAVTAAQLEREKAALDERIRAFQEKVAKLTV